MTKIWNACSPCERGLCSLSFRCYKDLRFNSTVLEVNDNEMDLIMKDGMDGGKFPTSSPANETDLILQVHLLIVKTWMGTFNEAS